MPDLGAMLSALEIVGGVLKRGDIVAYESTVYPGAVEEDCVPVLEKTSGLSIEAIFPVLLAKLKYQLLPKTFEMK